MIPSITTPPYTASLCYFSQSQENNGDEQGKYLENAEVFVRELRNDNEEDRYLKNLIYDNLANFYNKKSEEYLQDSITLQQALDYSQKALETYQKTGCRPRRKKTIRNIQDGLPDSLKQNTRSDRIGRRFICSFPTHTATRE